MHQRAFQSSLQRPSSGRSQHRPSGKMLLVTARRVANEKRSIYEMLRGSELQERKRTETALKAGEDRAILLGLGMIFCSAMIYFVTCITVVRSYNDSKWMEESMCTILNISVTEEMNCSYSCGVDCSRSSMFPCVQVYVSLNSTNRVGLLHHNEESENTGSKCFSIPKCQKDHAAMHAVIMNVSEKLREQRHVPCYYDPSDHQANFLLSRLYGSGAIFLSFFWPSCMLAGGATIILLVKLTQYLSTLCEHINKRSRWIFLLYATLSPALAIPGTPGVRWEYALEKTFTSRGNLESWRWELTREPKGSRHGCWEDMWNSSQWQELRIKPTLEL